MQRYILHYNMDFVLYRCVIFKDKEFILHVSELPPRLSSKLNVSWQPINAVSYLIV